MLIPCPSCGATYDVPDYRLRPGRRVRCAQCATDWVPLEAAEPDNQEPPEVEVRVDDAAGPPAPPAAPAVSAMDRLAAQAEVTQRGKATLRAAWAASLLLIVGCVAVGVVWRSEVMHLWPPSVRLFRALGLAG
jgi:predicted Zn finger-like uncharacterized protein